MYEARQDARRGREQVCGLSVQKRRQKCIEVDADERHVKKGFTSSRRRVGWRMKEGAREGGTEGEGTMGKRRSFKALRRRQSQRGGKVGWSGRRPKMGQDAFGESSR